MKTFLITKGTLDQIKWIPYGQRDQLIEEFILNEYTGPDKSPTELKSRKGEKEQIAVNLSPTALNRLEEYAIAAGEKVKRSHIFKDMMDQFVAKIKPTKNANLLALKKEVFGNISEINKYMSKDQIYEEIAAYIAENLEE